MCVSILFGSYKPCMFWNLRMFLGYSYSRQLLQARFPDLIESVGPFRSIATIATIKSIQSIGSSVQFGPHCFACFAYRQ